MRKTFTFDPTTPKPVSQIRMEWHRVDPSMQHTRTVLLPLALDQYRKEELTGREQDLYELFLGAAQSLMNYHDEMGMLLQALPEEETP